MARYKVIDISPRLLLVDLDAQLVQSSCAHALHHQFDPLNLSGINRL